MKKNKLFLTLLLAAAISAASAGQKKADATAVQKNTAALPMQKKLEMPGTVYAIPGIECNVYFRNLFMTINPANFAFHIKCKKGRSDEKRWYFTPKKSDVGTYDIELTVYNDDGVVARGYSKLVVTPADAAKGKTVSLLIIGASNIEVRHAYPKHIYSLFQTPGNPELTMIGENGPGWPDKIKNIRHEGYGGWSFWEFTSAGRRQRKGRRPVSNMRSNPFWNFKTKSIDMAAYFKKNNNGKAPDYVIIALGGNDIFRCTDETIDKKLATTRKQLNTLVAAIRKAAPDAVIALEKAELCSSSQDSFGNNYGCNGLLWQFMKNHRKYREMIDSAVADSKDKNLVRIDTFHALDRENNVPQRKEIANARNHRVKVLRQSNGLHPWDSGYNQTADVVYAWLINHISTAKK